MKLIEAYLESLPRETTGLIRLDQLVGLFKNLQTAIKDGDASALGQKRGFKSGKIVDVIEFCESPEWLNMGADPRGRIRGKLWDSQKEDLWRIWHEKPTPLEVVFTGSQGCAKSTTVAFSTIYMSYLVSRLENPQLELNMLPGDDIFIIIQSFKLETAEDALFGRIVRLVDGSPYFQKHFPRNTKLNSEIQWPNSVTLKPITGSINAIQSKNVIGGAITEINEMPIHQRSVKLAQTDKQVLDVGEEVFHNFRNRVVGRFKKAIQDGEFIGRIHIDSARRYLGDFTDKKTKEAESDPLILVIERSLWSARPFDYVGEKRFFVELATEYRPARILQRIEDAEQWSDEFRKERAKFKNDAWLRDNLNCIRVPESHRRDFEKDLEDGLRDFAGVPAMATGRFMPYPREITSAQEKFVARTGGASLFRVQEIILDKNMPWHELIDYEYLKQLIVEGEHFWGVHLDASLGAHDAAGMALSRVIGSQVEKKGYFWSMEAQQLQRVENIEMPIFCCDGALRILAPPGKHIDLVMLQDVIIELKQHIALKWATVDWMQSEQTLQTWRTHGIVSGNQSVDRTAGPYYVLSQAIRDGRILFPPHEVLDKELRQLKREVKGGEVKIDHPSGASKDVADALCGSVAICDRYFKKRIVQPREEISTQQEQSRPQQAMNRSEPIKQGQLSQEEIQKAIDPYGPNSIANNPNAGGSVGLVRG